MQLLMIIVMGTVMVFSIGAFACACYSETARTAYYLLATHALCIGVGICFFMTDESPIVATGFWGMALILFVTSIWQFTQTTTTN